MTTQSELFTPVSHGNLVMETPVVGRITFGPIANVALPPIDNVFRHGKGRMHFGNLATSKRLQDTLAVLKDGRWHTTREIRLATNSEAVHSDIAALRWNGIEIECESDEGKKYRYRLIQ